MLHVTNQTNACCLLALDALFHGDYPGKQFLEELYEECFQSEGIVVKYLHLLEECAPVKVICGQGIISSAYQQGDMYWVLIDWDAHKRYRLSYTQECILVYAVSDKESHAVCIRAMNINDYLKHYQYIVFILPTHGLIIDVPYER